MNNLPLTTHAKTILKESDIAISKIMATDTSISEEAAFRIYIAQKLADIERAPTVKKVGSHLEVIDMAIYNYRYQYLEPGYEIVVFTIISNKGTDAVRAIANQVAAEYFADKQPCKYFFLDYQVCQQYGASGTVKILFECN